MTVKQLYLKYFKEAEEIEFRALNDVIKTLEATADTLPKRVKYEAYKACYSLRVSSLTHYDSTLDSEVR